MFSLGGLWVHEIHDSVFKRSKREKKVFVHGDIRYDHLFFLSIQI